MATRYYRFSEDEYYHIYNRGNNKQVIFNEPSDYGRFIELLYLANGTERYRLRDIKGEEVFTTERGEPLVHIGAYSILPNHFHILLKPEVEDGVSKFMLKLGTSYSVYFNKKYKRTGSLFEGSYKAKHVDTDRYLKYLFAYIHLNPFRGKLQTMPHSLYTTQTLCEYPYSSLPDYLRAKRREECLLSQDKFPVYFATVKHHAQNLREWLDIDKEHDLLG